jgi:hypothetical protein
VNAAYRLLPTCLPLFLFNKIFRPYRPVRFIAAQACMVLSVKQSSLSQQLGAYFPARKKAAAPGFILAV